MIDRALFKLPGAQKMLMRLVGLDVLQALLVVGQALFLSRALTTLWQGQPLRAALGATGAFAICFAGRQAITWGDNRLLDDYARRVATKLRQQLLQKVFALGPAVVAARGTGSLVTMALDGIDNVENYLQLIFSKVMTMAITTVGVWLAACWLEWHAALIMLAVYPLIILFMVILGYAAQARADRQYENFQRLSNSFIDSLRGIATLKYFGLSKRYARSIFRSSEAFRKSTMDVLKIAMLSTFALDFFTTLSIAIIAVYLGFGLINGRLPLYPALAVLILAPEYFLPIRNFANDYHATLNGKNAFQDVMALLKTPAAPEPTVTLHAWRPTDELVVQDLAFRYPTGGTLAPSKCTCRGTKRSGLLGCPVRERRP